MCALSQMNAETLKRVPLPLSVRCTAHGSSFMTLRYSGSNFQARSSYKLTISTFSFEKCWSCPATRCGLLWMQWAIPVKKKQKQKTKKNKNKKKRY